MMWKLVELSGGKYSIEEAKLTPGRIYYSGSCNPNRFDMIDDNGNPRLNPSCRETWFKAHGAVWRIIDFSEYISLLWK